MRFQEPEASRWGERGETPFNFVVQNSTTEYHPEDTREHIRTIIDERTERLLTHRTGPDAGM